MDFMGERQVKLREMVLEASRLSSSQGLQQVVAPTVERSVRMQNHCDHLSARIASQHEILKLAVRCHLESWMLVENQLRKDALEAKSSRLLADFGLFNRCL